MKKLILFISLALAFSASFAGVKVPADFQNAIFVKCVHNNKIAPIKIDTSKSPTSPFLNQKINESYIFYCVKAYPLVTTKDSSKGTSCISYKVIQRADEFKKEKKNPKNYFQSYFDANYFNKYYQIQVKVEYATCGDTGKKIKPTTITKIKRFHPIILETEE